jgi:hypothetical protein
MLAAAKADDPICPVCNKPIGPDESTGTVDGTPAHLDCWIKRREDARRAPPRPPSK